MHIRSRVSLSVLLFTGSVVAACATQGSTTTGPATPVASSASASVTAPPPPAKPSKPVTKAALSDVGLDASALNKDAAPCNDFFEYACGGWLKKTNIPEDKSRWSRGFNEVAQRNEEHLRKILEQASQAPGVHGTVAPPNKMPATSDPNTLAIGRFYSACMAESVLEKEGTKPLDPLMKVARAVYDKKSLSKALTTLHQHRVWALFDISDTQDFKDATKVIANLDQNGLGLPDRDYYLASDERSVSLRKTYQEHVARMFKLLGSNDKAAKAAADDVMAIETELAKISKTKVERREPKGMYNRLDRKGLQTSTPGFDWDGYFKGLGVEKLTEITVTSVAFFEGLEKLLNSIKPAQWQTYLQWHVAHSMAPSLNKAFVNEAFELEKALSGAPKLRERFKRCIDATDGALGEVLAQPYVQSQFGPESKKAVEQMVAEISTAFGKNLDTLSWMDDETKNKARKKLKSVAYLIGYPKSWRTYNVKLDAKTHGANVLATRALETQYRLAKIGKPVDREAWEMTPPTVNAYYEPTRNQMVFPAGILQPPFYNPKASVAVNMGAMGMVVGHELTHGFDDEGSQFEWNGNLESWWNEDTRKRFEQKLECVVKQYSQYESLPGAKVDGKLTLGENVADIGGLKMAFEAYRAMRKDSPDTIEAEGFSEDQQFFLGFAQSWCMKGREEYLRNQVKLDPHSPAKFRVNGTVADTVEFGKAFSCNASAPLGGANQCVVW